MSIEDQVPLIWTTKGNLPIDSLQYSTEWEETETSIRFSEIHRLDGEIVKQSQHVLLKQGVSSLMEQEKL